MNKLFSHKSFVSINRSLVLMSRSVTYEVTPTGNKIVINKYPDRNHTKREKWQRIRPMGYEQPLRDIKRIELDPRLESDPQMARNTAFTKLQSMKDSLRNRGFDSIKNGFQ